MDFALLIQELFSGLFYMLSGDGFKTLIMFVIAGILISAIEGTAVKYY